jgi:predicted patatin/cPLA2 family phospholipase
MTDGGVADSIPVIKAYNMGARDITVILPSKRVSEITTQNTLAIAQSFVENPAAGKSYD